MENKQDFKLLGRPWLLIVLPITSGTSSLLTMKEVDSNMEEAMEMSSKKIAARQRPP